MTHLGSLGRRVSGFFTGLGGAGALAVLGDPHNGDRGYSNKPLTPTDSTTAQDHKQCEHSNIQARRQAKAINKRRTHRAHSTQVTLRKQIDFYRNNVIHQN